MQNMDMQSIIETVLQKKAPSTWQVFYAHPNFSGLGTLFSMGFIVTFVVLFLLHSFTVGVVIAAAFLLWIVLALIYGIMTANGALILHSDGLLECRNLRSYKVGRILSFSTIHHLDFSTKQYTRENRYRSVTRTSFYLDIYYRDRTTGRWLIDPIYGDPSHISRAIVWACQAYYMNPTV